MEDTKVTRNRRMVGAQIDPRWQVARRVLGLANRLRIHLKRGGSQSATNRLTREIRLAARGDDRRAGELLERWRWSGDGSTPSFVLATLELGRIAERLGDKRKAAECYGFVAAVWRRPDRELQPYAAEARDGLARLSAE